MDTLIANESSLRALNFELPQKRVSKVCEVDYCRIKLTKQGLLFIYMKFAFHQIAHVCTEYCTFRNKSSSKSCTLNTEHSRKIVHDWIFNN